MITGKDKFELLKKFEVIAKSKSWSISEVKEINYGLQFRVETDENKEIIRIFEGKKGVRFDFSQVKDEIFLSILEGILQPNGNKDASSKKPKLSVMSENYPDEIMGIDESGKGDFFGPLIIAGVYVDKKNKEILTELGVMDSKRLSDIQIKKLAKTIKDICPYSVVAISNTKYNELYKKIQNLNKLLAWGHARAIENLVEETECQYALSDQFGDEKLIKEALLKKGKSITLYQRTKAEEILAVAAASIIAREAYINKLGQLSKKYKLELPKGASAKTIQVAKQFISQYGKKELESVAKMHFKTTDRL